MDKIESTVEAWETGKLGNDENYVSTVKLDEDLVKDIIMDRVSNVDGDDQGLDYLG